MIKKIFFGFIASLFFVIVALIIASYIYGVRDKGYGFGMKEMPTQVDYPTRNFALDADGAFFKESNEAIILRAYQPQIELAITGQPKNQSITIENIAMDARLTYDASKIQVTETIEGINRSLNINCDCQEEQTLTISPAEKQRHLILVIGDSGADRELLWIIKQAEALGVDFIIHLGDLIYDDHELDSAIHYLHQSKVPIYVTPGNHDLYEAERFSFVENFAPMNNRFSLMGKEFIFLDIALHIFPFDYGPRGDLLNEMDEDLIDHQNDIFVFTHQPLTDSAYAERPELEHGMTGIAGRWLERRLKPFDNIRLFAGHVHQSIEVPIDRLPTYIVGEGLAVNNLIEGAPSPKMLLISFDDQPGFEKKWIDIAMPKSYHCSQKIINNAPEALKLELTQVCKELVEGAFIAQ